MHSSPPYRCADVVNSTRHVQVFSVKQGFSIRPLYLSPALSIGIFTTKRIKREYHRKHCDFSWWKKNSTASCDKLNHVWPKASRIVGKEPLSFGFCFLLAGIMSEFRVFHFLGAGRPGPVRSEV
jgi:hypothetical protein